MDELTLGHLVGTLRTTLSAAQEAAALRHAASARELAASAEARRVTIAFDTAGPAGSTASRPEAFDLASLAPPVALAITELTIRFECALSVDRGADLAAHDAVVCRFGDRAGGGVPSSVTIRLIGADREPDVLVDGAPLEEFLQR